MMKKVILLLVLFWMFFFSAPGEPSDPDGRLWTENAKTSNGRSYLEGFVRGYIEGRRWGIEMIEGTLPYVQFELSSPIDKEQIESKLLMETSYYVRSLEAGNLEATINLVTQWYQDPQNWRITWSKLVELAVGKINGFHENYVNYHLKWLRDLSIHRRINWFHTIDPATGAGQLRFYDEEGKIIQVEWVE